MSLVEGFSILYDENKYTDLTLITNDNVEYKCHKLVFSAVSKTLENKFLENEENSSEVKLEVASDLFEIVINYIYRDDLKLDCDNVVIDLYKFAFEYEFNKLMQEIKRYISENLTIRSALNILNNLKEYGIENLLDCYKTIIKDNVRQVIECEEFFNCPLELVVELTALEEINVSEIDLFNGVQKWMNHKKELEGAVGREDNLKIFYEELVKNIRFLAMTQAEFLVDPFNSYLLADKDKMSLISNICIPGSAPSPAGLSANRINRNISLNVFENIVGSYNYSDKSYYIQWQNLNVSRLYFNNKKEHISTMVELMNRGRFSITMDFIIKNNEECVCMGLQNCNEIPVHLYQCYLDIKNINKDFQLFDQSGYTKLDKNQSFKFRELPLKKIRDKGCLIGDSLEFQVRFAFP